MILTALVELVFARGGGGGSGGGGGGGGGGSGGGSGGFIVLAGYVPTHALGALMRRRFYGPVGFIVTTVGTLGYASAWLFAGSLGILIAIFALIGGPVGYFGWWSKVATAARRGAKLKQAMTGIALTDQAWDAAALEARVRDVFMRYQADWSNFNVENMKQYLTAHNWQYNNLMMVALQQRQRRNLVEQPQILECSPIDLINPPGTDHDVVTYYIRAQANDQLIDMASNRTLFVDTSVFEEYWHFARIGNDWMLDHIEQATSSVMSSDPKVLALAAANGYFYSLDWGWLLLPQRGDLFSKGKFGRSDINNHVIGVYHNVLIELYSYLPYSKQNQTFYTVAQAALPKRYDSLIVKAKDRYSFFHRMPRGYNKLRLEWPDFNRRYDVYATNVEQVTAFELLHPVYMEKLFALPFKVSIEVVDNVVYLYSNDKTADYDTMLSLLKDAFEEMML